MFWVRGKKILKIEILKVGVVNWKNWEKFGMWFLWVIKVWVVVLWDMVMFLGILVELDVYMIYVRFVGSILDWIWVEEGMEIVFNVLMEMVCMWLGKLNLFSKFGEIKIIVVDIFLRMKLSFFVGIFKFRG